MSSLKMTFSLASLILILGLVFVPTSVMGHPNVDQNDAHATAGHTHPIVTVEAAVRSNTNTTDATPLPVYGNFKEEYLSDLAFGDDPDTTATETNWAEIRFKFTITNTVAARQGNIDEAAEVEGAIDLTDAQGISIKGPATNQIDISATAPATGNSSEFYTNVTLTKGSGTGNDAPPALKHIVVTVPVGAFRGTRSFDVIKGTPDLSNGQLSLSQIPTSFSKSRPTPVTMLSIDVPSESYVVVVPPDHDASALPADATPHMITNFPDDLSTHFNTGGTIDVMLLGGTKHDVIITEIMLARDLNKVGQAGTDRPSAGQWIELYNTTDGKKTVSFDFSTGHPAKDAPTGSVDSLNSVDRLSNAVTPGWNFEAAFGGALTGSTQKDAEKNFVSLRRKHKDNKYFPGATILNGWDKGAWELTADSKVFLTGRIGTPGMVNRVEAFTPAVFKAPERVITFNEIANRADDNNEWIELKGPAGASLKKVKISKVTTANKDGNPGTETTVYQFPDNDDVKFPSNGILLITDKDPADNELAADLENGAAKEGVRYRIRTLKPLPNDEDGEFLLVLRDTDGNIEDVAGYASELSRDDPYTTLWPLAGNVGRISDQNKLTVGNVYKRARAIQGYSSNKDNGDEPAFEPAGFTGLGYDRGASVNEVNGGTPGYPNGAIINSGAKATDNVIISEIMYGTDGQKRFAQWIELRNMSATEAVDLNNWRLYITNHINVAKDGDEFDGELSQEIWLRNLKIPPKQTVLVVSRTGRHTTLLQQPHRLLNVRLANRLLNPYGFYLRLEAKSNESDLKKREAGDEAGNLVKYTGRSNQSFRDPAWPLPMGETEDGDRVSISRRTSPKIAMLDGTKQWHWVRSDEESRSYRVTANTYYGHVNDIGSPGQTIGSVLPVSLSKFRPERLDDGSIVIRWITESELNNAGFNILRSEKRDGQFTKINTSLIKGQGTTSERTTYSWMDKSAKPNVVYYYQIQDVSLDGQVQTLRQSRLKGDVSPAGKLTTQWAEIKALQ